MENRRGGLAFGALSGQALRRGKRGAGKNTFAALDLSCLRFRKRIDYRHIAETADQPDLFMKLKLDGSRRLQSYRY